MLDRPVVKQENKTWRNTGTNNALFVTRTRDLSVRGTQDFTLFRQLQMILREIDPAEVVTLLIRWPRNVNFLYRIGLEM